MSLKNSTLTFPVHTCQFPFMLGSIFAYGVASMSDTSRAIHWRMRATELRTIAISMSASDDRDTLIRLADYLNEMANRNDAVEVSHYS
jgi:hypothetical protein